MRVIPAFNASALRTRMLCLCCRDICTLLATAPGSIPQELGALDKLEELVLFNNKLSGELPRNSDGFARLQRWIGKRVPDT